MNTEHRLKIVQSSMDASPALGQYFAEAYGMVEFDTCDDNVLRRATNESIQFVHDELYELGILLVDGTEFETEYEIILSSILLRKMFNITHFVELLRNSTYREFTTTLLESGDYAPELFLEELITTLHEYNKLSIDLSILEHTISNYYNDDRFIRHIVSILNMPEETPYVPEAVMYQYLDCLATHINTVDERVHVITTSPKFARVKFNMKQYDRDLANLPSEHMAIYMEDGHPANCELPTDIDFITEHKAQRDHHFEHYRASQSIPDLRQSVALVVDMIDDTKSYDQNKAQLEDRIAFVGFESEVAEVLFEILEFYFAHKPVTD